MKLIVAVDSEWGIGNKGDLLARIRADLNNFRRLTDGKTVILGSNTLSTFPGGRVLKNRVNIVLHPDESYRPEGAVMAHSIPQAVELAKRYGGEETFAIGGASVYRQLLPYCDTAYVTKFKKSYEKDVYFENLDESPEWELAEESEVMYSDPEKDTDPDLAYTFCVYKRVLPAVFVRDANAGDVEEIYRMLKTVADRHRELRPDIMGATESKYTREELRSLVSGQGGTRVFVAECGKKVCGHVFCEVKQGFVRDLYIDDLCVDAAYRRRGAGKKLMARAEAYGRESGCAFVLLNVWDGNTEAEEFYRNYGMTERSRYLEKRI
ncbi:MAG: GNAT family N-acetyltransferase [Clostridia bacterium]|nr:GNAT family N-acetyltransferase [Clostridia bacterium]